MTTPVFDLGPGKLYHIGDVRRVVWYAVLTYLTPFVDCGTLGSGCKIVSPIVSGGLTEIEKGIERASFLFPQCVTYLIRSVYPDLNLGGEGKGSVLGVNISNLSYVNQET